MTEVADHGRLSADAARLSNDGANLETRKWFKAVARTGLAARGVIYFLLSYLALDIALHGNSPTQASGEGALQEIAKQRAAPLLLIVLATGLGSYGLWRLVQALAGKSNPSRGRSEVDRIGWLAIAVVYFALCVQAIELLIGRSHSQSGPSNPKPWAATILTWPGGPELLGTVGACLIIGGLVLTIWGFAHDYHKDLVLEQLGSTSRKVVNALGASGDLSRGFLVALVGSYLIDAAILTDPSRAKSVDAALKSLVRASYGPLAIGLVACGLLFFALYSFCEARLRRL
ncbi:MAG: DUF1206 domain-containing protein [Acidimicrobiales bacterium]|jgi:hypothetical protein